jgi:hypothetical protein
MWAHSASCDRAHTLQLHMPDRRSPERIAPDPCDKCGARNVQIVVRTQYVLYARCPVCGHLWSIEKPGQPQPGY